MTRTLPGTHIRGGIQTAAEGGLPARVALLNSHTWKSPLNAYPTQSPEADKSA